jgi:hypothetical protein
MILHVVGVFFRHFHYYAVLNFWSAGFAGIMHYYCMLGFFVLVIALMGYFVLCISDQLQVGLGFGIVWKAGCIYWRVRH